MKFAKENCYLHRVKYFYLFFVFAFLRIEKSKYKFINKFSPNICNFFVFPIGFYYYRIKYITFLLPSFFKSKKRLNLNNNQ